MLPAYFEAMTPVLHVQFAWVAAAALVGVVAVTCLVLLDEMRSRHPRGRVTLTEGCAPAREAA
jgi:TRAP-type C4-dicarboxylate transport system permease small subunit